MQPPLRLAFGYLGTDRSVFKWLAFSRCITFKMIYFSLKALSVAHISKESAMLTLFAVRVRKSLAIVTANSDSCVLNLESEGQNSGPLLNQVPKNPRLHPNTALSLHFFQLQRERWWDIHVSPTLLSLFFLCFRSLFFFVFSSLFFFL